ncbi:MAG: hypothetical protein ACYC91_02720 [Solirubrobacteraceae bacterium]
MVLPDRGICAVSAAIVVGLFAGPVAGSSLAATQPTDPKANSPAGVIYSIPLDSARQDAAPHFSGHGTPGAIGGSSSGGSGGPPSSGLGGGSGSSGTPGGTGAGTAGGSSGGFASPVPDSGVPSGGSGASATAGQVVAAAFGFLGGAASGLPGRGAASVLIPGGQPGSLIHSANGFGSSSQVPGLNVAPSAGLGVVQNGASDAPLLAILVTVVVLVVGAFAGGRAWRVSGRATPPSAL